MNAKHCRMIRQIVKERGYSPMVAKRIKKQLQKFGETTPDRALINEILDVALTLSSMYNDNEEGADVTDK